MATVNISIHDSASPQGSPTVEKGVTEDLAPTSGGAAPGSVESSGSQSSVAYGETASGHAVTDIGSPPAWLHEAIAADKAYTASDNTEGSASGTDGGAGPTD
jgi:hypothetical protein